ncbi:3-keto-5-aminohexanoate cleavage protein [Microbacterium sp. RD1]|uniref:3-keto-5-aminohexanoate cleavage protein n=1 Tax=Microbacterium sp. RD1 TaxID=3457313 RepID=UPI003FA61087
MDVTITVAPTGPIATKKDNPTLPTQPLEIAEEVHRAYLAGASIAHIHLRDEDDRPTADLDIARRTIDLIQERCDILIQLSTGVGLAVPFEERARLVELRPPMATLNPCTMSFGDAMFLNPPGDVRELAARMRDLQVKPELEIYDTGHVEAALRLRDDGLLGEEPLQVSIVLGVRGGMAATAENLLMIAGRLPADAVWQVIAIGRPNLELTAIALALGGNARAGMEDTLYLGKGVKTDGNLPLVERAVALAAALGRRPRTVAETREALALARATVAADDALATQR